MDSESFFIFTLISSIFISGGIGSYKEDASIGCIVFGILFLIICLITRVICNREIKRKGK
jgi:hypothetical protein